MLIRCEKKLKSVFLKTTSQSGCGLSGWSVRSLQKQTNFPLDLSVLNTKCWAYHPNGSTSTEEFDSSL
jgi:hypothetical protein